MEITRTDGSRRAHDNDDDGQATSSTPSRGSSVTQPPGSDAQRGATKMDAWIQNQNQSRRESLSPAELMFAAAPSSNGTCNYKTNEAACPRASVPRATLFVKGEGDVDSVDANDIRQRQIGDCHLLGPALAMLQTPQGRARIHDMIKEVKRDGKTTYEVTWRMPLHPAEREANGLPYKEVTVTVDDKFIEGHAAVGDVDVKSWKTEVWPLVLEASYAKLMGGYGKIDGGCGTVGLSNLTGKMAVEKTLSHAPVSVGGGLASAGDASENGTDARCSTADLQRDFAAHKPTCITFTRQPTTWNEFGAFTFHCYALTNVFTKDGETYVQLSNDWGHSNPKPIPLKDLESLHPQVSIGEIP